jgi:hypothetical protein
LLDIHYSHLLGRDFLPEIKAFMRCTPIIACCWEGTDCVNTVRLLCGITAELAARYEHWLAAMHELLQTLPDERLDQLVRVPARYHPTLDDESMTLRDALLHAIEHGALHQGHLELTRQLLGYAPAGAQ